MMTAVIEIMSDFPIWKADPYLPWQQEKRSAAKIRLTSIVRCVTIAFFSLSSSLKLAEDGSEEVEFDADHEKTLVRRAQSGDSNAFRGLYDLHSSEVFSFLCRASPCPTTAEDLLQETFLRAFRSIRSFRQQASFRTWLFTIARNCLSTQRAKTRSDIINLPEHDSVLGQAVANPEELSLLQEQLKGVETALDLMKLDFREIFLLRQVHGLSYDQLAVVLNIPLGTVKSRLNRALTEFWQCFREVHHDHE